jgi:hypothetical protein
MSSKDSVVAPLRGAVEVETRVPSSPIIMEQDS